MTRTVSLYTCMADCGGLAGNARSAEPAATDPCRMANYRAGRHNFAVRNGRGSSMAGLAGAGLGLTSRGSPPGVGPGAQPARGRPPGARPGAPVSR
jgi:hypothetical protein